MRIVKDAFGSLWRGALALVATSRERRAVRELQSFDSRTLADIGIKPGDIEFAVRHGRPSQTNQVNQVNAGPFSRPIERRKAYAPPARERTPLLRVILLIVGLVPFGAMLSWASLATKASSQGELHMNGTEDWHQVYDFWFPPNLGQADAASFRRRAEWWFAGGANAELSPFAHTLTAARSGRLDHWIATPQGRLSLIIVLDQFPRGLYAGKADAYTADAQALRIAEEGLRNGHHYEALTQPWERTFFMLPLAHAEGPDHLQRLDRAVAMAQEIAHDAPDRLKPYYEFSLSQARANRDLIARFGRFPHRNAILGRASTPEEAAYLKVGDLVHMRRPPAERMPANMQ
jgi:uncharacterized protein (DUF924 family)/uncharacterized protein YjiS (DUF1127 family)